MTINIVGGDSGNLWTSQVLKSPESAARVSLKSNGSDDRRLSGSKQLFQQIFCFHVNLPENAEWKMILIATSRTAEAEKFFDEVSSINKSSNGEWQGENMAIDYLASNEAVNGLLKDFHKVSFSNHRLCHLKYRPRPPLFWCIMNDCFSKRKAIWANTTNHNKTARRTSGYLRQIAAWVEEMGRAEGDFSRNFMHNANDVLTPATAETLEQLYVHCACHFR